MEDQSPEAYAFFKNWVAGTKEADIQFLEEHLAIRCADLDMGECRDEVQCREAIALIEARLAFLKGTPASLPSPGTRQAAPQSVPQPALQPVPRPPPKVEEQVFYEPLWWSEKYVGAFFGTLLISALILFAYFSWRFGVSGFTVKLGIVCALLPAVTVAWTTYLNDVSEFEKLRTSPDRVTA
jgi:hypothetical protein